MAIHVYCPGCEALLAYSDAQAGTTTRCSKCGIEFNVPNPFPAAQPVEEEPTKVFEPSKVVEPVHEPAKVVEPTMKDAGDETIVVGKIVPPTAGDKEADRRRAPSRPVSPPPVKRWDEEREAPYEGRRRPRRNEAQARSIFSSNLIIILGALAIALMVLLIGFLGLSTMGQGNFRGGQKVPVNIRRF